MSDKAPGRVYAGRSEDQRRAERRARLMQAGFELFGTEGWAGATIERLCATGNVATRSFYEEFASREALLLAVYQQVMADAVQAVLPRVTVGTPEERIRAGLTAYVDFLTEDPRKARIAHREVRVAGVLEHDRHAMVLQFADLIAAQTELDGPDGQLLALAMAGAVAEVLVDWVARPEPRPATGPLVDALARLLVAAVTPPRA